MSLERDRRSAFADELPTGRARRQPSRPDVESEAPDSVVNLGQLMAAIEIQRRDVSTLTTEVLGGRREIKDLADEVHDIRDDVRALRRRMLKGFLGAGSTVAVVEIVIEVARRFGVAH